MESSSNRSLIQTPPYLRAFCGKKTPGFWGQEIGIVLRKVLSGR